VVLGPIMGASRVYRRVDGLTQQVTEDWGTWERAITASEVLLTGQPRQDEINYCVTATNDQGQSIPSNLVMVGL
jgi:hypothetical protein